MVGDSDIVVLNRDRIYYLNTYMVNSNTPDWVCQIGCSVFHRRDPTRPPTHSRCDIDSAASSGYNALAVCLHPKYATTSEWIVLMKADWPAENIVLALLCERPMHGYELAQVVKTDAALRAIWRIELSEVYFLLRKLLKLGFIVEHAEEDSGTRPRRVLYTPTPAGQAAFETWLTTPEKYPRNLRTALLARVYLALRRDPALAAQLVDAQKEHLTTWLQRERDRVYEDGLVALVHRFRAAQVEAALVALDELRRLALDRADATAATIPASTM